MSSSGSTRRAASIISRSTGHMVARMQAATLVVPKPTPRACTECQTNHNQVADGFGNNRISVARSMLSALNQLRYDLRKLKGHGLLQRDGSRYAYRLTPKGVQVGLLF